MKNEYKKLLTWRRLGGPAALICFILFANAQPETNAPRVEDRRARIENALYTRSDFFGADALVPRPTADAREALLTLTNEFTDDIEIMRDLAGCEERLLHFDDAERVLSRLAEIDPANGTELVDFYDRRARFVDEAKVLASRLSAPGDNDKVAIAARLLDLAKRHDLNEYLQPAFYRQIIADNPGMFPLFDELIEGLMTDKSYAAALDLIRHSKTQFPDQHDALLQREIAVLLEMKRYKEAEEVYRLAFDPFWTDDEAEKFYSFLSDHDRLREYGGELEAKFAKATDDFQTAIRLAGYRKYCGDEITPVIVRLQRAKKIWSADELVIISRILLHAGDGDLASRFLYTLYVRDDIKTKGDLREKVLYQLFEMFSDAAFQKLPLANGDLRFYEDVAKADIDPGITTGLLSLVFSDTDPRGELDKQETIANKHFNRAAAYRLFLAYKQEYPASAELGQMYLDIVRLYTATGETAIAETTLNEFTESYRASADYPLAALKLADAYAAAGNQAKSRAICQDLLDHLGKQSPPAPPGSAAQTAPSASDQSSQVKSFAGERNRGIRIPDTVGKDQAYPGGMAVQGNFTDYLDERPSPVTYSEVLELIVSSLAREKKTAGILELYSNEIAKYPQVEWLYEQRLAWLEQTNLTEEQLAVYREALNRFQTNTWSDKLARWFVRQNRQSDLAELSTGLVAKLSDTETQAYLSEIVDQKTSGTEFERQLYLQLYLAAHRRFPHNLAFVNGLLRFYRTNKQYDEWRRLAGEYFFVSPDTRKLFLDDLAANGELRQYLASAASDDPVYKLFRADAAIRLSNFEQAVGVYQELNAAYPNSPEFTGPLFALTRSFGQNDHAPLTAAADIAHQRAEYLPSSADLRTQSGEVLAEAGDYPAARGEWEKLVQTESGSREVYLDAATVYWDYFQYNDALRTIGQMRKKFADDDLNAFEAGAIYEALNERPAAIREYVKALASTDDDMQPGKASDRLEVLWERGDAGGQIAAAFVTESARRPDISELSLGYARFLSATKRPADATKVLERAIGQSRDIEFLTSTLEFFSDATDAVGKQATLRRMAAISENPRRRIKYSLQLALTLEEAHDRDAAETVLGSLIREFPKNYGVVTEASDLFHRLGDDAMSVQTLQNALALSRGGYKTDIAARLSRRMVRLDRLDEAETILTKLHDENRGNIELFRELARVLVKKGEPDALRKVFDETVASLKHSDADRRELDAALWELRTQMIDAFTRLQDYGSAVEQHIELINREPEREELTAAAIAYVKRYGGGPALLAYYQKTSAEAFKNYRWNVVLAKIYEANGDIQSAVDNYASAIADQPEMAGLYIAAADLESGRGNYDAALKYVDTAIELTDAAPENIRKKIEILKRAGRTKDAAAEQAKLKQADKPIVKVDPFAAALANPEKDEARRLYRQAFDTLLADPLAGDLKSSSIVDYVTAVRDEEPLNKISEQIWTLRRRLIEIADEADSTRAGEARKRLATLDPAMISAIGDIAGRVATDAELAALHGDLKDKIGQVAAGDDRHQTIGVIQDISRRAHFGDLEEMVLVKRLEQANPVERATRLSALLDFYNQRGAYDRALGAVSQYGEDGLAAKAGAARLTGDREAELAALRALYQRPVTTYGTASEADVTRYLQLLYAGGRDELATLTRRASPYQYQLINFLLGKGEFDLARDAIDSADMPPAWKISRLAETSLALKQYGPSSRCFFCEAMQIAPIGEMAVRQPDKQQNPVGDDWFRLGREYGEWLYLSPQRGVKPSQFLTAMIENHPHDADEQSKLGDFYLSSSEPATAIGYFRLALELAPGDTAISTRLGAAYYLAGRRDEAEAAWRPVLTDPAPSDLTVYFDEMDSYGLGQIARASIVPGIVSYLKEHNVDNSDELSDLIRSVARSIRDDGQRSEYFQEILKRRPTDISLAKMIIDESLTGASHADVFYERLISAGPAMDAYEQDYTFKAVAERTWSREDAEAMYEQENKYQIAEPENERYGWQKLYLEKLLTGKDDKKAAGILSQVETELQGKYARPDWLRLAALRLQIRAGLADAGPLREFVGISVRDSVTEINPPSLERFNAAVKLLKDEGRPEMAAELTQGYYARCLALGQYSSANFAGLARMYFDGGDTETGLRLLQLISDISSDTKKDESIAEVVGLEIVKQFAADAARLAPSDQDETDPHEASLDLAATIAAEYKMTDAAIAFRQELAAAAPSDGANLIELARLLAKKGEKPAAEGLLGRVVDGRDTPRAIRWRAVWQLHEIDSGSPVPDIAFDPYSQYYRAKLAGNATERSSLLVSALIDGGDGTLPIMPDLIRAYLAAGRPSAAFKMADTDQSQKPDDLLDALRDAAERAGEIDRALGFEKLKTAGGDAQTIKRLEQLSEKLNRRATDLVVDAGNTQKL